MKLNLINCAVASDGGSIALSFTTETNDEFWVSLDKGLQSPTRNKIFASTYGESPLTSEQENELLPLLETAEISEADCEQLLRQIINEIKCR
ncbi:hypothetical protein MAH1_16970 [Sessilibacter sp. MAH1]